MRYRWFCFLRVCGFIHYPKMDNSDLNDLLKQATKKASETLERNNMSVGIPAAPSLPYFMMCGDYRETLVAIHGPNGHIASGLRTEQAKPILDELNRLNSLSETLSN